MSMRTFLTYKIFIINKDKNIFVPSAGGVIYP